MTIRVCVVCFESAQHKDGGPLRNLRAVASNRVATSYLSMSYAIGLVQRFQFLLPMWQFRTKPNTKWRALKAPGNLFFKVPTLNGGAVTLEWSFHLRVGAMATALRGHGLLEDMRTQSRGHGTHRAVIRQQLAFAAR
jgi:hypothetical protein